MKSRHLSLRIDEQAYEQLEAMARRERETVSETARRLIEEGRRMAEHPGIVFRPGPTGVRAAIADGPDVWEVIEAFPAWDPKWDIKSHEGLGGTSVTARQVMQAQRYYRDYPGEIDARIEANREAAEKSYEDWLLTQSAVAR
ncbi:MAG TPA: hypothetical protein VFX19_09120 [Dehalococcoidia bacterium]|nr:hypothetical protein [Dehalococcoidia bacterium]